MEPAVAVMNFLLSAREQGYVLDAAAASKIMEAVCTARTCHMPLDVNDYSLQVQVRGFACYPSCLSPCPLSLSLS